MLGPHLVSITSLEQLDLSSNELGAEGARVLTQYLTNLSLLRCLGLRGHNIGAEGARTLALIGCLNALQHLDVCLNHIQDGGARALGIHLATLLSLRQVLLDFNSVFQDTKEHIRSTLAMVHGLKV